MLRGAGRLERRFGRPASVSLAHSSSQLTCAVVRGAEVGWAAPALGAAALKVVPLGPPLLLHQQHLQLVVRQQGGVQAAAAPRGAVQEPRGVCRPREKLAAQLLRGGGAGAVLVAARQLLQRPRQQPADCNVGGSGGRSGRVQPQVPGCGGASPLLPQAAEGARADGTSPASYGTPACSTAARGRWVDSHSIATQSPQKTPRWVDSHSIATR
jgi:hypothetical protein